MSSSGKTVRGNQQRHQGAFASLPGLLGCAVEQDVLFLPARIIQRLCRAAPAMSYIGNDGIAFSDHPFISAGNGKTLRHRFQRRVQRFVVPIGDHTAVQIRENKNQSDLRMRLFQIPEYGCAEMIKTTVATKIEFFSSILNQLSAGCIQPSLNSVSISHFLVAAKRDLHFSSPRLSLILPQKRQMVQLQGLFLDRSILQ